MKHLFLFKKLIKRLSFISLRWVDSLIIVVEDKKKKKKKNKSKKKATHFYVGWPCITTLCLGFHFLRDIGYYSSMKKNNAMQFEIATLLLASSNITMSILNVS